jgi:hypothetical protein
MLARRPHEAGSPPEISGIIPLLPLAERYEEATRPFEPAGGSLMQMSRGFLKPAGLLTDDSRTTKEPGQQRVDPD